MNSIRRGQTTLWHQTATITVHHSSIFFRMDKADYSTKKVRVTSVTSDA